MKWKDTFVKAVIAYFIFGDTEGLRVALGMAGCLCLQYIAPRVCQLAKQLFLKSEGADHLDTKSVTAVKNHSFTIQSIRKYMIYLRKKILTWLLGDKKRGQTEIEDIVERMSAYTGSVFVED